MSEDIIERAERLVRDIEQDCNEESGRAQFGTATLRYAVGVMRALVHDLRGARQTIASQAALLEMGEYEEVGAVVAAAEHIRDADRITHELIGSLEDRVDLMRAKRGQR